MPENNTTAQWVALVSEVRCEEIDALRTEHFCFRTLLERLLKLTVTNCPRLTHRDVIVCVDTS